MTAPRVTPPAETSASASGRTSTPRAEGIQHMVDATVALLREMPPEQITVRMVSGRSGHHHRFVSEWFGGKSGLFRAALDALLASASTDSALFGSDATTIHPDVRISIHLMNWLNTNGEGGVLASPPAHFRERLAQSFVDGFGADPELADLLARRVVLGTIGLVLFGDIMEIDEETFIRLRQIEIRAAQLLAGEQA